MSTGQQISSTPIGVSRVEKLLVNDNDVIIEEEECNLEAFNPLLDTNTKEAEVENPFQAFKKPRKSKAWDDFLEPELINKQWKEWEIEDKVFTISVDNASANDSCITILKENFATNGRLLCNGKLYHVRCCSVMDHRLKMRAVKIAFPKMFPSHLVKENIGKVKDIMCQLFDEYVRMHSSSCNVEESGECAFPTDVHGDATLSGFSELLQDVFSGETSVPRNDDKQPKEIIIPISSKESTA
ncbi:hypothetical protein HRI_004130300 [Hibiscus trionum]|uniref:Uncharacterized protein n=1 Tax=Hibiscus trionum TaxID=183268 RepID=A0A9W7IXS1_HIBTR|nr:hypothetical protein HRI_004130300 [Hibiscus trionum]